MKLIDSRLLGLLRLIKGHRLRYAVAALSTGIASLSQTGTYLLLRRFVDVALPGRNLSSILLVASGFIGLAGFSIRRKRA